METPLKEQIENEKHKYVKRYVREKDYWAVWQFIFTGKLVDTSWINDKQ